MSTPVTATVVQPKAVRREWAITALSTNVGLVIDFLQRNGCPWVKFDTTDGFKFPSLSGHHYECPFGSIIVTEDHLFHILTQPQYEKDYEEV